MNKLLNIALIWKLAIFRLFLYCLGATIGSYLGAMTQTHWHDLDSDAKFCLLIGILSVNIGIVGAFIDKTISNMSQGDSLPPSIDGSVLLSKTVETKTSPPKPETPAAPAVPEITATVVTTTTAPKPEAIT